MSWILLCCEAQSEYSNFKSRPDAVQWLWTKPHIKRSNARPQRKQNLGKDALSSSTTLENKVGNRTWVGWHDSCYLSYTSVAGS